MILYVRIDGCGNTQTSHIEYGEVHQWIIKRLTDFKPSKNILPMLQNHPLATSVIWRNRFVVIGGPGYRPSGIEEIYSRSVEYFDGIEQYRAGQPVLSWKPLPDTIYVRKATSCVWDGCFLL
jgi:hypothetical protein